MPKSQKVVNGNPAGNLPVPAGAAVQFSDIEQVLEHVSSPYRWEILEIPLAEHRKTHQHEMKKQ